MIQAQTVESIVMLADGHHGIELNIVTTDGEKVQWVVSREKFVQILNEWVSKNSWTTFQPVEVLT